MNLYLPILNKCKSTGSPTNRKIHLQTLSPFSAKNNLHLHSASVDIDSMDWGRWQVTAMAVTASNFLQVAYEPFSDQKWTASIWFANFSEVTSALAHCRPVVIGRSFRLSTGYKIGAISNDPEHTGNKLVVEIISNRLAEFVFEHGGVHAKITTYLLRLPFRERKEIINLESDAFTMPFGESFQVKFASGALWVQAIEWSSRNRRFWIKVWRNFNKIVRIKRPLLSASHTLVVIHRQ